MLDLQRAWLARGRAEDAMREAGTRRRVREAATRRRMRETGRQEPEAHRVGTAHVAPVGQATADGRPGADDTRVDPRAAWIRLSIEAGAVYLPVIAFGLAYGMATRVAGFTLLDLEAMNLLVFAGGSQLMAVSLLASGLPWLPIVAMTVALNARHTLYSASLAPWFAGRSRLVRAIAAYVVVDESYALTDAHFRRIGRLDARAYAAAALVLMATWLVSMAFGWATAQGIPPRFAVLLDVVAPASMAGLAVLLITDRASLLAALAAASLAVGLGVMVEPALGVAAGGLLGVVAVTAIGHLGHRWSNGSKRDRCDERPDLVASASRQPARG